MIIRCCVCQKIMGIKEPVSDTHYTDGYCRFHELITLREGKLINPWETIELMARIWSKKIARFLCRAIGRKCRLDVFLTAIEWAGIDILLSAVMGGLLAYIVVALSWK